MSGALARIGRSDAQANADALARRDVPYGRENRATVARAFDWRNREPRDLREAVRLVRAAYADEIPQRMVEGSDTYNLDGSPRFAAEAAAYIFDGRATGEPFRSLLAVMEAGAEPERRRAAIVRHVTIGSQGPKEAAIAEDVPAWCAGLVAEDTLRGFLRSLSAIRLDSGAAAA